MESYDQLLEKAYREVKKIDHSGERFAIPKAEGRFAGKKTQITNFGPIANHLRRPAEHLMKFLLKELATTGYQDNDWLILNNKISGAKVNPKIEQYTKEFVLCNECGKPDTEIVKEEKVSYLHCLACGAKHPIRSRI